jgi:multidrug resistance efflux pump
LKSAGAVSESDVDRVRIAVATERILAELQTIVDLRRKEAARCKQLFDAKAISSDELKQAANALEAAERRLAEWQQNEPIKR